MAQLKGQKSNELGLLQPQDRIEEPESVLDFRSCNRLIENSACL